MFSSVIVGVVLLCGRAPPPNVMATCPRCKGHLTDSHRCPRRSIFVAVEVIVAALAGGAAGLLLVIIFDPTGRQITDLESALSVVVGACAAVGINRALRG
jgi:hypothetical protein